MADSVERNRLARRARALSGEGAMPMRDRRLQNGLLDTAIWCCPAHPLRVRMEWAGA